MGVHSRWTTSYRDHNLRNKSTTSSNAALEACMHQTMAFAWVLPLSRVFPRQLPTDSKRSISDERYYLSKIYWREKVEGGKSGSKIMRTLIIVRSEFSTRHVVSVLSHHESLLNTAIVSRSRNTTETFFEPRRAGEGWGWARKRI